MMMFERVGGDLGAKATTENLIQVTQSECTVSYDMLLYDMGEITDQSETSEEECHPSKWRGILYFLWYSRGGGETYFVLSVIFLMGCGWSVVIGYVYKLPFLPTSLRAYSNLVSF